MDDKPPLYLLVYVLLIGFIVFAPQTAVTSPEGTTTLSECVFGKINIPYIPIVITSGSIVSEVIQCESGWKHYDKNGNVKVGDTHLQNHSYGICQFQIRTWETFNKERGTNLDIMSRDDQLDMIDWAFKNGKQNHWTCFRKVVNNN